MSDERVVSEEVADLRKEIKRQNRWDRWQRRWQREEYPRLRGHGRRSR